MKTCNNPDLILYNGKIVTLDPNETITEAVAIKNSRILSTGPDEKIRKLAKPTTRYLDLEGRTMLPGFIDSHTHLGPAALSLYYNVDGRCPPNRSVGDILERIHTRVGEPPAGEWIIPSMSIFADLKLKEKRFPTKEELDEVAPKNPVCIFASHHTQIVNTCALKAAKVTKDIPDPPEGKIERHAATGEATGILRECNKLLPIPHFTQAQRREAIEAIARRYWIQQGVTTVCSFADAGEFSVYHELNRNNALPLRIQIMPMDRDLGPYPIINSMVTLGIRAGLGNEFLKIGGVKIKIDGALMGLSAATYAPYQHVSEPDFCGNLLFEDQSELNSLVLSAHNAGLQVCLHAIGDKAQDWALDALEHVLQTNPRAHRHRIEHLGNLMTSPQRIQRAKNLSIMPVVQCEWIFEKGDFIEHFLGADRKAHSWPLRSMLDAGLNVANSSDTLGAAPFSINPFFSIWCAVTRRTFRGDQLVPAEAVSVAEALRFYTTNAAYTVFEEDRKGSIEPGKMADLIVLDRDILTIPEDEIKDIKVEMTIIDGKIVYQKE